jgi:hypothetical protein
MLFVSVPERNGVIVARAHAKPPRYKSCIGNGKSCLFQSNKVNSDNVRNMLRILHLTDKIMKFFSGQNI